jgi:hypothetical protein
LEGFLSKKLISEWRFSGKIETHFWIYFSPAMVGKRVEIFLQIYFREDDAK